MTQLPSLPSGHVPTGAELSIIETAITRSIPIKGLLLTTTSSPIATTSGTTELDMPKYAMTGLTIVTNRYYMYRANITFTKTVSSDGFDFRLRANTAVSGSLIGQTGFQPTDSLSGGDLTYEFMFKGDASYTALYLSVVRSSGTGTLSYSGAQTGSGPLLYRSWAVLHDLGDSDNWTDVA